MNIVEYLKCVIKDDKYIEWINEVDKDNIVTFHNKVPIEQTFVDEELLLEVASKMHEKEEELEEEFWETILSYLSPESISQSVFDYLIKNHLGIISLSHIPELDDKKLEVLTEYECRDEAVFFLGKKHYTNDKYSAKDFCKLLKKYANEWVLDQLLLYTPNDPKKEHILYYFYCGKEEQDEYSKSEIKAKKLRITDNLEEIRSAYTLNDPTLNLAIANNLFTPDDILEELTKISGIKCASEIRKNSRETKKIKNLLRTTKS